MELLASKNERPLARPLTMVKRTVSLPAPPWRLNVQKAYPPDPAADVSGRGRRFKQREADIFPSGSTITLSPPHLSNW